jgi:ElaB/YqjD/DUF883 family membrane-anchored ribosome-binding protein
VKTRLAQLVAQATDTDGHLDRAALYDALSMAPDDPVALIIEAFLATEGSRKLLTSDLTAEHEAAEESLRRVAADVADIAAEHSEVMNAALAELRTAKEANAKESDRLQREFAEQGDKLAAATKAFRETGEKLKQRGGWQIFIVGLLAGAAVVLGIVLWLK